MIAQPALQGRRRSLQLPSGRVSFFEGADRAVDHGRPLLLIHSVNAAASAYEMRPLYDHYRKLRPVYALDLPGFGFSERSDRLYTPRLMTDAVHGMVDHLRHEHGDVPIDAVALSLGCEFLARAAQEKPDRYRSLGLVAPTALRLVRGGINGSPDEKPRLFRLLRVRVWSRRLFDLMVMRPSIRHFFRKAWGTRAVDESLVDAAWRAAHQPGARHAPFSFLAGYLFSADARHLYAALPQPVWLVSGDRGEFALDLNSDPLATQPAWHPEVMNAGAMPHVETPVEFVRRYDVFLERLALAAQAARRQGSTRGEALRSPVRRVL